MACWKIQQQKKKKAKSRSARARGSAVVVAGVGSSQRFCAGTRSRRKLRMSCRCIHWSWWDDCSVLCNPTVAGSSSTLPCFLICRSPWVFGSIMKSQQSGHSPVPPGHSTVPPVPPSSPKGFVPSVGQGTTACATAASSGEHRIFLRYAPFCRVARRMH